MNSGHQALERNPFSLVLSLRFAPIAPFNIINFLLALTTINLKIYTLATLIGVIPGTIAYTWLGASGKTALQRRDASSFIFASVFLVLLSVSPCYFNAGGSSNKFSTRFVRKRRLLSSCITIY
ncbi:TVP38/TMEM64 family protein [Dulcicalothrix desertica]|uniref:TVP38/TMEM64 family protein n=1 Tax=Dulcicalothrix desertica TaxID=32056 RepID=UPI001C99398D